MDYPELKRAPRQQYERFKPDDVLIEDKASGTLEEMSKARIALSTAYQRPWRNRSKSFRMPAMVIVRVAIAAFALGPTRKAA